MARLKHIVKGDEELALKLVILLFAELLIGDLDVSVVFFYKNLFGRIFHAFILLSFLILKGLFFKIRQEERVSA